MNNIQQQKQPTLPIFLGLLCLWMMCWSSSVYSENLSLSDQSRHYEPTQFPAPVTRYSKHDKGSQSVGSSMLYYEDTLHTETIDSITSRPLAWTHIQRASPNFGFTDTAYWFKFQIKNEDPHDNEVYIELPIPFLDSVQIYQLEDKKVSTHYIAGDMYRFSERPIAHQNFVFPFSIQPGNTEFILRVSSAGTVEAPLLIWNPVNHAQATAEDRMIQGLWGGMIAIMVIYNLLLFFSIRDVSYFYYVVFAFGYLMFQASLKGYGFAYLWPEHLSWNSYAISTFIALCNVSVILLVISFLDLKERFPKAYKMMNGLAIFSGVLFLATFILPYSLTIRLTSAITLLTCTLSLGLGYYALYKGQKDAKHYCLAWTATFIGQGVLGAVKFGFFSANFWTNNSGQIGVIILVSLLSLALANRINREKELRLSAQANALESETKARQSREELLEAQTNINAQLEQKVQERTRSMQKALNDLEQANNRLELASTTDSLTTLFNRRHFESRLHIEFKRAQRHDRDLSVILLDIDHFKSVNDKYGHKVGDECLRHIAVILKNTITRSGDIIARYGGEEFILLLVDTPLKEAEYLAELLCKQFSESAFESNGDIIAVTASFGVASLSQHKSESADKLVDHADIAMYEAKRAGRNQVVTWQAKQDQEPS